MKSGFPPHDLDCPDPAHCPVEVSKLAHLAASRTLLRAPISSRRSWFRVYDSRDGFGQPNPGYGDTRFTPFDSASGQRVPTLYLAESLEAALLETSFHNVSGLHDRVVAENALHGKLHAQVLPPTDLSLVDLRDPQLARLGLPRESIVSSPAEHYPCTRRVALVFHAALDADGILWHSRQAELTGRPPQEVAVVFADRVNSQRGAWQLAPGTRALGSLLEGHGRMELDVLAEILEVVIEGVDD